MSINCKQNKLLRVSFVEQFDFIIYQHLNKRTTILPFATSQIAHLWNQFNHVCTANFKATFWKHNFFIKIALKFSYFCKKTQNFRALGAPPPDPRASGGWSPKTAPPLRISDYAPALLYLPFPSCVSTWYESTRWLLTSSDTKNSCLINLQHYND